MALLILVITLLGLSFLYLRRKSHRGETPLPPGPPTEPILGHLRILPHPEKLAETLHEWAKVYGDVMYLKCLGREMIILDSAEAAHDLLNKRGSNYSSRSKLPLYTELMGWTPTLPFLEYGPQFIKHRKLAVQFYARREVETYVPIITKHCHSLVKNLLEDPENFRKSALRFSTSISVRLALGHDVTSKDDKLYDVSLDLAEAFEGTGPPGNSPVDFFPWLRFMPRWFPGTHYATIARSQYNRVRGGHEYAFEDCRKRIHNETIKKPSFISWLYETLPHDDENFHDMKGALATALAGSIHTTAATLTVFMLAMTLYPECAVKAQQEIDMMMGSDRLPTLKDRPYLPYVEGVLQETFRWYPVVPMGLPHRTLEDDIYNGMFIPKDALVFGNVRAMGMNEQVYKNPSVFDPSRFVPKADGNHEPFFNQFAFGFGRRVCPGQYLADSSLWLAMATILAVFNVSKKRDVNGVEITPKCEFDVGLINTPMPFEYSLTVRSDKAKDLILDLGSNT